MTRSALWGRVLPNSLGLPTYVQFNKAAASLLTDTYMAEKKPSEDVEGGAYILLSRAPAGSRGVRLTKSGRLNLGSVLDDFNRPEQPLTDQPFPVLRKRLHGGDVLAFELHLLAPDPELRHGSEARESARPMRLEAPASQPRGMNAEMLVKMYALVSLIEGEISETELERVATDEGKAGRPLLASLPGQGDLEARFGTIPRFLEFLEFQRTKLQRQRKSQNDLQNELYELLERRD